jgi:hypothetical protein
MSWNQELIGYDLNISDEKVKAFIEEARRNEAGFEQVTIEEPERGLSSRRIDIDGWVLTLSGRTGEIDEILEWPSDGDTDCDSAVMDLIAKYSDDGYVEMCSESGHLWRWVFLKGRSYRIAAEISWPTVKEPEPQMGFVKGAWIPLNGEVSECK